MSVDTNPLRENAEAIAAKLGDTRIEWLRMSPVAQWERIDDATVGSLRGGERLFVLERSETVA